MVQTFVVPALEGPISGGTRYNAELLRALAALGVPTRAVSLDEARRLVSTGEPGRYWVDSLYLSDLPELRALAGRDTRFGLLLHYLPSLIARAFGREGSDFERVEALAIESVDAILVPSAFLRLELERRGVRDRAVLELEPGVETRALSEAPPLGRVAAQMVGNVLRSKGIAEFFAALAAVLIPSDDFSLHVAGGEAAEPAYARECRELARTHAVLRTRVHFDGPLEPRAVERRLALSNLFVSASFTETYGMALAEARAAGVPILARGGGNVRAHVSSESGGELVATHTELAHAFASLCRDRRELERRSRLARTYALAHERPSWGEAARRFRDALTAMGE